MSALASSLSATTRLGTKSAKRLVQTPVRQAGRFRPFVEKEIPVKETMLRPKKRVRCYLWGGTLSGALGRDKFVRPLGVTIDRVSHHCSYPSKIGFSENHMMKDIACGYGFTIFAARHDERLNDFELFGTGINSDSQLGSQKADNKADMRLLTEPVPIRFPTHENGRRIHVRKVAAGRAHTIAVTDQGIAYGLGNNSLGQCGREIDPDEVYFGRDLVRRIRVPGKVAEVVCGLDHTLFLTESGEVYACGWGADGQTGLGHYGNTGVPQKVQGDIEGVRIVELATRGDCSLAVSSSGDVFGWGNNEYGQLLGEKGESQRHTPKHIRFNKRIKKVAAGGSSCLASDEEGRVYCWGYGILGLGPAVGHSSSPKQIPAALFGATELSPNTRVVSLASGLNDFAAINDQGHLFTWGRNQNGCLGLGHEKNQMFPLKVNIAVRVAKVSIGVDHMAAITQSYC
ncbi:RCC1-like G exchanging factor-like protein [Galendromus occidentalis]|uniref:RCC1-like G exchanging factor-like protein n=1 Tax=Galendromus occidentalis TaxID=34638 RepID=A0AAJ6QQA1_9ACAR|nr:RCC1-like G exchanging factor-like protein [Galendromus occidentalis]